MYISINEKDTGHIIIEGIPPEELEGGKPTWYASWGDKIYMEKEKVFGQDRIILTLKGYVPATLELVKQLDTKKIKEYLEKHPDHQKDLEDTLVEKLKEEIRR